MKNKTFLMSLVLLVYILNPVGLFGQKVVQEYKIQHLISDVIINKFQQINNKVEIYEHKEGNRLIMVGDSADIKLATEQLELLDRKQMMVTIEFMLIEYFHENDFEWGIDITQGTSGNFKGVNYTPSAQGSDLSFGFNAVTKLAPSFQLNVRSLVSEDRAKIMTNPHLVAESGTEARLSIKDRRTVTLETATVNGITTTLQNIEAGIEMIITPVPTHDSLIHLTIDGTVSEFLPFSSAGEFLIEENKINTAVDVRHGETLILGGLILEETNDLDGGVPVLKNIPLLGRLFKKKRKVTNYVERVMYITPYLHSFGDAADYKKIRDLTPLERNVEKVIEEDPGFLKYENTKNSMRKKRRKGSRK